MKVVNQNVLVKVEVKEKNTNSGISWPDTLESEGLSKATVISVSPDLSDKINEGDRILIYKNAGKKFTNPDDNEKYNVVNISEIVVVL